VSPKKEEVKTKERRKAVISLAGKGEEGQLVSQRQSRGGKRRTKKRVWFLRGEEKRVRKESKGDSRLSTGYVKKNPETSVWGFTWWERQYASAT